MAGYIPVKTVWAVVFILLMQPIAFGCSWLEDIEQTNRFTQKLLASLSKEPLVKIKKPAYSPAAMKDIEHHILNTSQKTGVHPEFIRAVIRAESGFNSRAKSPKGAMGLMQLMPATCGDYGVVDPFDPAANIEGGTRFLKNLLIEFRDVETALAAYNFGPGNIRRNVPWPRETREYVKKVITTYKKSR